MIVVQFLITSLVIWLFNFIGMPLVFSALFGTLVWSLVLFKTPVFGWFFINVKANWAVILGNQTIYDQIPKGLLSGSNQAPNAVDPRTKMYNLKSLREIGPGLRGKFPWEIPFESIDLRSEIVIGNDKTPLKCYTEDNIERTVTWQAILTPLRGHLVNLVRKGEDASQSYFKGRFETKIREWMRKRQDKDVDTGSTDLKDEFSNTFGGENQISQTEEDYGMFTNTPQILTINRSDSYQKAAEAVMVAEKVQEMLKKLKVQLPKADQNMLLAAATAIVGNDINGLLLIPGLSRDPKILAALTSSVGSVGAKASTKNSKGKT
jgi:hypothetical protein